MIQQQTKGIQISVETFYQPDQSHPIRSEFLFVYRITIANHSAAPIQLLSRKWIISEGNGIKRIVEGEGVVGKQPVIHPGESYQYVSAAHIRTEIGSMKGHYIMQQLPSQAALLIPIPEFPLIAPFKLN